MGSRILALLILVGLVSSSCEEDFTPKPRAFYRINFPEKSYQTLQADCPYSFEIPTYATKEEDMKGDEAYCWLNLNYQEFNAKLHLSYKPIIEETDFQFLINDAYTFVEKHNLKAERITEEKIISDDQGATGLLFLIGGNSASNMQFFLTDSSSHFLRASLYFNCEPNKDSLAPVVSYIKEDIEHLIKTFSWTEKELEIFR